MNILSLENVSKTYGIKPLLSAVSFGLDERDKIGVIGANGSGKSTLLRIIAGEEPPDAGRVVAASGKVIAALWQNPPFDPEQSVIDAVFSGGNEALHRKLELLRRYEEALAQLSAPDADVESLNERVSNLSAQLEVSGVWQLEAELKAMLSALGITQLNAKMGELSGGQRKRVALAHSLFIKPDLLILDEPTNHLDAETVEWLEGWLADFTGALLLVTHDRYFLDRITNRILEIDGGRVSAFTGNYQRYLEQRQEREEQQAVRAQKLKQMARRELEWLRRGPKARTSKAKARIDRAHELIDQSRQAASELAARRTLDSGFETVGASRLGRKVIGLEGVSKSFAEKTVIRDFSFQFKRGDRIGVIGANGSGKTTLLEIISGRLTPDSGEVDRGQSVIIGYYDQENREFDESLRLIDYIKEVAESVVISDGSVITASQMLDRFLFPPAMQYQPIATLSGGERRRLYLLRMLMSAPNVLLLDEITNDLDIPTLVALEEYLENFAGCLVIVSHDRYFLDRTIDYILRFEIAPEGGYRIREYPGDYSAFLEIREREKAETKAREQKVASVAAVAKEAPAVRRLTFKEKRELEELVVRIAAASERRAAIDTELAANSSDHILVAKLYDELQALTASLDRDEERWVELEELAGQ